MKLLIQLNFGLLGNLYVGVTQLLHFANYYKQLGYKCDLIFASNSGGRNGYSIPDIKFEELFDLEGFEVFDTITTIPNSITEKQYGEYICYGSSLPGVQWWDVFFNQEVDEFFSLYYKNYDNNVFSKNIVLPTILPKFNKTVYDKVKLFKEHHPEINSTVQLRLYGYGDKENHNQRLTKVYEELYHSIKKSDKTFFLTSSCVSCLDDIIELPNVILFGSRNLQENKGDVNFDNINGREKQIDTLYDYIAEMVMIGETDNVYYYSIHWQSTFLYYSFVNNPNITILHINDLK